LLYIFKVVICAAHHSKTPARGACLAANTSFERAAVVPSSHITPNQRDSCRKSRGNPRKRLDASALRLSVLESYFIVCPRKHCGQVLVCGDWGLGRRRGMFSRNA